MASAQAHRLGVPVDLPPPLDLTGRTREEAMAWAVATERRLVVAQQSLDTAGTDARRRRLMADLPTAAAVAPDTARALAAYQATLHASRVVDRPEPPDVDDAVAAILRRVDPDATTDEHDAVLRVALLARTRPDVHDADAYLVALRRLVDVEIKNKVAARRQAAQWLEALDLPVVATALGAEPRPPFAGTAARLRAVVAGTAELTDGLRDEGRRAAAFAAEETRREFLRDRLLQRLTEAGYAVDGESRSARGTRLTATRADWHGEHSARLLIARDGAVTGRLARRRPGGGDDAHARDRARCGELHTLLQGLADSSSGVRVTVDAHRPPVLDYDENTSSTVDATQHEPLRHRTRG
jgi:hypothetical protein